MLHVSLYKRLVEEKEEKKNNSGNEKRNLCLHWLCYNVCGLS